jgi:hypothetical protein
MGGWKYEWALALPPEVYDVIVEEIRREAEEHDAR